MTPYPRDRPGRALASAALLAALAAIPRAAAADDDDDGASVSEEPCPLGKGRKAGKIVTTTEKEACGSGGCTQMQTTELEDGDGKTLIVWSEDVGGDFGGPSSLSFACSGGAVVISDDKGELLKLSYEPAEHKLRLAASVRKQVEDGWRAPPVRGAAAAERERLAEALGALTPNALGAYDTPPFEVLGLDPELEHSQVLLVARDKVEAGAWETAETMTDRAVPTKPPPTDVVARRREAVRERLAALRRQSAPVVVADRRRVGTVLATPTTPVDADAAPNLFWRGDALCVGQEDHKPPTEMRCLDAKTRKWGAREPMRQPRSSGEHLRSMTFPNVDRCEGMWVVQKTVPENDQIPCSGGAGEDAEELVAVVAGDAMLLANEFGLRVNRGPKKTDGVSAGKASALIAGSAGTLVVGNGCCRFLSDGRVTRFGKQSDERRWPVLGPPPEGQFWHYAPLVSPSQRWAVAFSKGNAAPAVTLWLLRLTARR